MIGIFAVLADGKRASPRRLKDSPCGATTPTPILAALLELVHGLSQNRPIDTHRCTSRGTSPPDVTPPGRFVSAA